MILKIFIYAWLLMPLIMYFVVTYFIWAGVGEWWPLAILAQFIFTGVAICYLAWAADCVYKMGDL